MLRNPEFPEPEPEFRTSLIRTEIPGHWISRIWSGNSESFFQLENFPIFDLNIRIYSSFLARNRIPVFVLGSGTSGTFAYFKLGAVYLIPRSRQPSFHVNEKLCNLYFFFQFYSISFSLIYFRIFLIQTKKGPNSRTTKVTIIKNAFGKSIPAKVTTEKYFQDLRQLWK